MHQRVQQNRWQSFCNTFDVVIISVIICMYLSLNTCIPVSMCAGEWPSLVDKYHQQKVALHQLARWATDWTRSLSHNKAFNLSLVLAGLSLSTRASLALKYISPVHHNPHGTSNDFKEQLLFVSRLFLGFYPSSFSLHLTSCPCLDVSHE